MPGLFSSKRSAFLNSDSKQKTTGTQAVTAAELRQGVRISLTAASRKGTGATAAAVFSQPNGRLDGRKRVVVEPK